MNFGIMSSQIDLLIPAGLPPEDLMSHIANYSHAQLIRQISEHGFNTIELSGDLQILLPSLYSSQSLQELLKLKSDLDLCFTIHLPLWSVEPSTLLSPVRDGSVKALIHHINLVKPLEPEIYVLHATGALAAEFYRMNIPQIAKGYLLNQFINEAKGSILKILSGTGIQNKKIAIETIEFPFGMTLALADELDISICFDTGHILAGFAGPIDFFDALEQSLPRIAEIHLHDSPLYKGDNSIGYGKDHQTLGKGDLDVVRFFDILIASNFKGPIIFELKMDEALDSLSMIQNLILAKI
jgi:sugar phosphate isomerase/epimerase